MAQEIANGITTDPAVMVGKPVIKGTRMPVELVLAKLAANPDLDEFFLDYPELTVEDVKAVLAYASTLASSSSASPWIARPNKRSSRSRSSWPRIRRHLRSSSS
jgi:uncharacterized protein (DUF433 family)